MKFHIVYGSMVSGSIQYNQSELSFDTIENEERLFTIILEDLYLGLDIGVDCKTVCAISGLSSPRLWKPSKIELPYAKDGKLTVNVPEFVQGCGYSYSGDWHICYDRDTKMILVSKSTYETDYGDNCQYVKFLKNAISVLRGTELIALYIEGVNIY